MHWVSNPLPSTEDVCAGQSLHVASAIAAAAVLYLPREHSVQAADPFSFLYVPAVHAVHATPSEPVYPFMQVQLYMLTLPCPDDACAGQALHGADPSTALYVPSAHTAHAPQGVCWLAYAEYADSPAGHIEQFWRMAVADASSSLSNDDQERSRKANTCACWLASALSNTWKPSTSTMMDQLPSLAPWLWLTASVVPYRSSSACAFMRTSMDVTLNKRMFQPVPSLNSAVNSGVPVIVQTSHALEGRHRSRKTRGSEIRMGSLVRRTTLCLALSAWAECGRSLNMLKLHAPLRELQHSSFFAQRSALRILDIGCGPGTSVAALHSFFQQAEFDGELNIHAGDTVQANLKLYQHVAQLLAQQSGIRSSVRSSVMDIGAPPAMDEAFDLIIAMNVLNELPEPRRASSWRSTGC